MSCVVPVSPPAPAPAPAPASRAGCRVALLVAGSLAAAVAVPAPRAAHADDALSARFRFERAMRLYDARRFDDALHELFLLQRVTDNPRVSFNIGLCYQQLGRDEEAFLAFAEYLAAVDPGDPDGGQRARAEQAVAGLEARVARLRVESDPPGATIFVDRTSVGDFGETPRLLAVSPGPHRLVLALDGHHRAEANVDAVPGAEVPVRVALVPVTGTVVVRSETPGASARLRDLGAAVVAEGAVPLTADLPPGTYSLELEAPGHQRRSEVLAVAPDEVTAWSGRLEREPTPSGRLTVATTPPGARLRLDDELAGFTPLALREQPAGTLQLQVELEGYQPWSSEVDLSPDAHLMVTVALAPDAGVQHSAATWVLGAAGAALLAAGVGVGVAAIDNRHDYEALQASSAESGLSPLASAELSRIADRGYRLRIAADALLVSGAVALAAAVVLWVIEDARGGGESRGTVAPFPAR